MTRKIIAASHGGLSEGIINTANMILGSVEIDLKSYCLVPGMNANEFAEDIKQAIEKEPDSEFIILTDLYGASVCTAMTGLLKYAGVRLFTGMNINMLLALCVEYPNRLSDDDVNKIIADAKEGIKAISVSDLAEDNEDF